MKDWEEYRECMEAIQHGPTDGQGRCPFCHKKIEPKMPRPSFTSHTFVCSTCGGKGYGCTCVEDGLVEPEYPYEEKW